MRTTKIVEANETNVALAGERVRAGKLVSFPTETVFGLGANGLDGDACLSIFKAKQRPLTDPLILHIYDKSQLNGIFGDLSPKQNQIIQCLITCFWPGPLTLVAKAGANIPDLVTANTGFVGVRIPLHSTAIKLLEAAKVPIAAPSANLFGHVSPTKAKHVYHDFAPNVDLWILDPIEEVCSVGVESTVLKIGEDELIVYRQGGVSMAQVEGALKEAEIKVKILEAKKEKKEKKHVAPGQEITHYAPNLVTFLLRDNVAELSGEVMIVEYLEEGKKEGKFERIRLDQLVVICFNSESGWKDVLKVIELSSEGDIDIAAKNLFSSLRDAEQVPQATHCLIVLPETNKVQHPLLPALLDRVFRASSGKIVQKLSLTT